MRTFDLSEQLWRDHALCSGRTDIEWCPRNYNETTCALPKAICRQCPVREDCLQDALDFPSLGVRGGTTPSERRRMAFRPTPVRSLS